MALEVSRAERILVTAEGPNITRMSGGNSSVSRVVDGQDVYAVKNYAGRSDGFSRQQREWEALEFLRHAMPNLAPVPLWRSPNRPLSIFGWLPGEKPLLQDEAVRAMADILYSLKYAYGSAPKNSRLLPAVDAANELTDLAEQITGRLNSLAAINDRALLEISDSVERRLLQLVERIARKNRGTSPLLTLSPSDFGPHNMIYAGEDSTYRIIDLEFFGVDDVHKLIGDTILHPQNSWTPGTLQLFLDEMEKYFQFSWERLSDFLPFLSLKWAVIVAGRLSREPFSEVVERRRADLADLALFYTNLTHAGSSESVFERIVERSRQINNLIRGEE